MTVQQATLNPSNSTAHVDAPTGEVIVSMYREASGTSPANASLVPDGVVSAEFTRDGSDRATAVDLTYGFTFGESVVYVTSVAD